MNKLILFVALFAALATAFPQQDSEDFSLGGFPFEDEEFSMTGFPDFSLMGMEEGAEDIAINDALFAREDAEVDQVELQLIGSYRQCKRRCRYTYSHSYHQYQKCKRRCAQYWGYYPMKF